MKCSRCYTEVANGAKFCPVCGNAIGEEAAMFDRMREERRALHPPKSKGVAIFVAWITCGIFTWKYLGDDRQFKERLSHFGLLKIIVWPVKDIVGIISGSMCYSDGIEVW